MIDNTRLKLHHKLKMILRNENCYYQPPDNLKINYPAIIYRLSAIDNYNADDEVYRQEKGYTIILVERGIEGDVFFNLSVLPRIKFQTQYIKNGLRHSVFELVQNTILNLKEETNYG